MIKNKIFIFTNYDKVELESDVNDFLNDMDVNERFVDAKFSGSYAGDGDAKYSVLIILETILPD